MTGVLILAAGSSRRMGTNKQFLKIAGEEVLRHSVRAFYDLPGVSPVIVVVQKEEEARVKALLCDFVGITVAPVGGDTRQQSVENGVKLLPKCDTVAIHDGARPLVRRDDILKTIEAAKQSGGAVLGVMAKDTIKVTEDGFVEHTVDRSKLFITQTPQVFVFEKYLAAMEEVKNRGLDFTDDAQAFELLGLPVETVLGHYSNIKVTTPEDMYMAEALYRFEKENEQ